MKVLFLDDVLPMISNGIKAVQKFEEFLDNSIEEDCFFECPKVRQQLSSGGNGF